MFHLGSVPLFDWCVSPSSGLYTLKRHSTLSNSLSNKREHFSWNKIVEEMASGVQWGLRSVYAMFARLLLCFQLM